jgi:rare lipoprotein A
MPAFRSRACRLSADCCSSRPSLRARLHGEGAASGTAAGARTPSAKYYKDDGPGESVPATIDALPDAVPRAEPLHRFANRPYTVFGREYVPATTLRTYKERGVASWYGRKFHGERTSSGEVYDMYAMTAAHPTLPLPSPGSRAWPRQAWWCASTAAARSAQSRDRSV